MAVAARLLAAHGLQKTWHGLKLATAESQAGPTLVVESVAEESPAEQAGLEPGDVITKMGGRTVSRALDFHRALLDLSAGDRMELMVERGQETLKMTLQLAKVPSKLKPAISPYWELLGLEFKPIPPDGLQQEFRSQYRGGLSVTAVRPHSLAADRGIRRGDVLLGMHIWETISLDNVDYIVHRPDLASFNPVKIWILRESKIHYGSLPIPVAMRSAQRR
jgi:serine protease Do